MNCDLTHQAKIATLSTATLLFLLTAVPSAAADDNGPHAVDVNIVAHEDDDSLFMNPDILKSIQAGHRVVTVYLTAGNLLTNQTWYMHDREAGAMDAYSTMVQIAQGIPAAQTKPSRTHWERGQQRFGPAAEDASGPFLLDFASVEGEPGKPKPDVQLVFVRLDAALDTAGDPVNIDIQGNAVSGHISLRSLWNDTTGMRRIQSIDGQTTYTRSQLIQLIESILLSYKPDLVRTQDSSFTSEPNGGGPDHSDHYHGAQFAFAALQNYLTKKPAPPPVLQLYCGYNIQDKPANLTDLDKTNKQWTFFYYLLNDTNIRGGDGHTTVSVGNIGFGGWIGKEYSFKYFAPYMVSPNGCASPN